MATLKRPTNGQDSSDGSMDGGSVVPPLPTTYRGSKLKRSPFLYYMTTSRDHEPKDRKPSKSKTAAPSGPPCPTYESFRLKRKDPSQAVRPDPTTRERDVDDILVEQVSGLVINEDEEGVKEQAWDGVGGMKKVTFSSQTLQTLGTSRSSASIASVAASTSTSSVTNNETEKLQYYYTASAGSLQQFLDKPSENIPIKTSSSYTKLQAQAEAISRNDQWKTVVHEDMRGTSGMGVNSRGSISLADFSSRKHNLSAQQLNDVVRAERMARCSTVVGGGMQGEGAGLVYGSSNFSQNGMNAGWDFDAARGSPAKGNANWNASPASKSSAHMGIENFAQDTPSSGPMNRLQARMDALEAQMNELKQTAKSRNNESATSQTLSPMAQ